jgi:anaerobic dimethyl sulfoxide reductase subunit A
MTAPAPAAERVVPVACSYNCGGRCVLRAHVRDGRVVRVSTDETPDLEDNPQLRACLKGRSSHLRINHPDRLLHPLKRTGPRGSGAFQRISWDEATSLLAENLRRILDAYGPQSVYHMYATGDQGALSGRHCARRLMNLLGGYLDYYNSYSSACVSYLAPFVTGCKDTSGYDTLQHSRLIVLNGFNPAETVFETNSCHWLGKARAAGAKVVVIDPVCTETAATFADQWIPLRPTTDAALFAAMAHVIITEGLQDQAFLDAHCVGFDEAHMPDGVPPGNSYRSYVLGLADGQPKTPGWAEPITGVDARTIRNLALEFATSRPAQLIQGLGPQRHAYGELSVWAGIALACLTGNLGVPGGGWGGGQSTRLDTFRMDLAIPAGPNPVRAAIPVFMWTDAAVRGRSMTAADGVRNGPLQSGIKFIWNLAGNTLVNQHADINRTVGILRDERLVEYIVTSDLFLTSSARYSDLVLPSDHAFERCDLGEPWLGSRYVIMGSQAVEPPGECRHAYDWLSEAARKLGVGEAFTEGRSKEDWLRHLVAQVQADNPGFPPWEALKAAGVHKDPTRQYVAFAAEIAQPDQHPFPTPSGKVEIFSKTLYDMNNPEIPGIPKYLPAWEGPEDPLRRRFPLQCLGSHSKRRVHSTYDESEWMEEAEPQVLWISPADAQARGLKEGERVKVFNDRGALTIRAHLSKRVRPGIVVIPQGAWYTPDAQGVCQRGCVNVLTSQRPTPLAHGNAQHTVLVEVAKP